MSSTAGIRTLCLVLSVNLCTLTAFPDPSCKMKKILNLLEYELKEVNTTLKVHHVPHNAELIHPLVIDKSFPLHKQNKTAACGLLYMREALKQIRDHQSTLTHDEQLQSQLNQMITRLTEHIPPCTRHVLVKCDHVTQPTFPKSHFKAKKWTLNFLESSVKFLHQLIQFLEKHKKLEDHQ